MPRDGSGVYSAPAGTTASPNTTIESSKYNALVADLVSDANAARPITAGGTGATNKQAALDALMSGTTLFAGNGTAAAPTISFASDSDTGLYRVGANSLGFATAGAMAATLTQSALTLSANAALVVSGTGAATTRANLGLVIGTDVQAYDADTAKVDTVQTWSATQAFGQFAVDGSTTGLRLTSTDSWAVDSSMGSTSTTARVRFRNPNGIVGTIQTGGSGTAYNTTSDGDLKVNRVPLGEEMDIGIIFDTLNPVAYDWLNSLTMEPTGQRGYGLVAQEVFEVLPIAVSVGTGDAGSEGFMPWAIDYSKLVPFLVAEIKALRQRVADLEA